MIENSVFYDVISTFFDIGTICWKPSFSIEGKDSSVFYSNDGWYYGMPFSRRNWMFYDKFCSLLNDRVYNVPVGAKKIPGVNCAGSLIDAVRRYIKIPDNYETFEMMTDKDLSLPVGIFYNKIDGNFLVDESKSYCFSSDDFYDAYSKLDFCDYLGRYFKKSKKGGWYGHIRLVTGVPFVKRTVLGHIDPEQSYLIISENNVNFTDNSVLFNVDECSFKYNFNQKLTNIKNFSDLRNCKTHFVFNKKVSFFNLYKNLYFPYRFKKFFR